MKDPRTLTEVCHARQAEPCVTCDESVGRYRLADWRVAGDGQCLEHAAVALTNGIIRGIARYAITEAADLNDDWMEAVS